MPNASESYGLIEGSAARRLAFLGGKSIGIIGCGHLGNVIALQLVSGGFPLDRLRVSRGKSDGSLQKILNAGLGPCLAGNEEICRDCSIIFICIRPQSLPELQPLTFSRNALVVSCMAGVSLPAIRRLLGVEAVRMMPSGPDSILEGKGIAAIYPHNQALSQVLQALGLRIFELAAEGQMHIFTAGICLPAALLASGEGEDGGEKACRSLSRQYSDFPEIFSWARGVLPHLVREEDKEDYIRKMATRGGVTEAIIKSLERGDNLLMS
ncbi:MAG TPA: NAD(P)-binding domain-containing protein, partial [Methanothrix sp.]|nr:NAD(P)-binding domain-containing protein [Methanothrix sp.]